MFDNNMKMIAQYNTSISHYEVYCSSNGDYVGAVAVVYISSSARWRHLFLVDKNSVVYRVPFGLLA